MLTRIVRFILLVMCGFIAQAYTQPANLVLQDTTITTMAVFAASSSITAGPNFTIASSGDVSLKTDGFIYLRPMIVIIQGGTLQAISETTLVNVRMPEPEEKPSEFALWQNYPNPFNPTTTIKFDLPQSTEVRLIVFDLLGREVSALVNERREAGYHQVTFNASGLSSGIYFYTLHAGDFMQTRKLLLLR